MSVEMPTTVEEVGALSDSQFEALKWHVEREAENRRREREGWEVKLVFRMGGYPPGEPCYDLGTAMERFRAAVEKDIRTATDYMREPDRVLPSEVKLTWRYEHVAPVTAGGR